MLPPARCLTRFLLAGLLLATAASAGADEASKLDPRWRTFLTDVALIISKQERKDFLALNQDYQREAFIYRFWEARNPHPGSSHNDFRRAWEDRVQTSRERYGNLTEDRARMMLLHGEPRDVLKTDCGMSTWPLEIWRLALNENAPIDAVLLFYQPAGGGPYRLWHHEDSVAVLMSLDNPTSNLVQEDLTFFEKWLVKHCTSDANAILGAVMKAATEDASHVIDSLEAAPKVRDAEWLDSFHSSSTDLTAGAQPLPATVAVSYPAQERGHTVLQGLVSVPSGDAQPVELEGHRAYAFRLVGEILRDSSLVESFRYRFDLPAGAVAAPLPLVFERTLWPGQYVLVLRIEDLHSHRQYREERPLSVPTAEGLPDVATSVRPPEVAAVLASARASLGAGSDGGAEAPAIHLTPPLLEVVTGSVRLEAQVAGAAIDTVTFALDGKDMLTRRRPPYTVELNLGETPETHRVRAVALDREGHELASDSLILNPPRQRFGVDLLSPRPGSSVRDAVVARAEVRVPDGKRLDRLELFLGDTRVATLYQPPWSQLIALPQRGAPGFVRAVAYLGSGETAEDLAVINSKDVVEKLDVRLVQLYATVTGRDGHPVATLEPADFLVNDGGAPQTLMRVERVRNLPLHLLLAIDTSASMRSSLPAVVKSALAFLHHTLQPGDHAAVLTFSDNPVIRQPFTGDLSTLTSALAGLDAERGTALFDGVVYGLSYMKGVGTGQSAMVLFTDGGDHLSRLSLDETITYARRSGIAIYPIGAQIGRLDLPARTALSKLAAATGGRAFFPAGLGEIDAVYATIEEELRSRYLLAYQPTRPPHEGEYRTVDVRVRETGMEVKTAPGYTP